MNIRWTEEAVVCLEHISLHISEWYALSDPRL
jgi:hypothetical protein